MVQDQHSCLCQNPSFLFYDLSQTHTILPVFCLQFSFIYYFAPLLYVLLKGVSNVFPRFSHDFPKLNPIFFQDFPGLSEDFPRFPKIFQDISKFLQLYLLNSPAPGTFPRAQVRPFDAKADGTVFGDAVAALVLRRHEDAMVISFTINIIYTICAGLHIILYIYIYICICICMQDYILYCLYIYIWLYYIYNDLSYICICAVMLYYIHDYIWYMDLIEHEAFYRVKSPCLSGCRKGRRGEWPGVCRPEGLRGETLGEPWSQGCSSSTYVNSSIKVEDFGIFFWGYPLVM